MKLIQSSCNYFFFGVRIALSFLSVFGVVPEWDDKCTSPEVLNLREIASELKSTLFYSVMMERPNSSNREIVVL